MRNNQTACKVIKSILIIVQTADSRHRVSNMMKEQEGDRGKKQSFFAEDNAPGRTMLPLRISPKQR